MKIYDLLNGKKKEPKRIVKTLREWADDGIEYGTILCQKTLSSKIIVIHSEYLQSSLTCNGYAFLVLTDRPFVTNDLSREAYIWDGVQE